MNRFIVGAYATAPSLGGGSEEEERDFYRLLTESCPSIRGLEIPFWGENLHQFSSDFLYEMMKDDWESVLTCIPGTMSALSEDKHFGLASADEESRKRAVAMHRKANQRVRECNEHFGHQAILSVQIATAPSMPVDGVSSSLDGLEKSLEEMLAWDWQGARVVIEHCDAAIDKRRFEKGFLSLHEEMEMLEKFSDSFSPGATVNWARSAIEGRSPDTPVDHLAMLRDKGLLSGLIFSGVSEQDEAYGEWKDAHMPFARVFGVDGYEENSLLNYESLCNVFNVINVNELDYMGVKLLAMPIGEASLERRVEVNRDALHILDRMLPEPASI